MPQEMLNQATGLKPWVEMDLDSYYREQYGMSFSEMQTSNPTDPTQQLKVLRDAGSVEKIGKEKIRGASAIHYRAVIDLKKAAAQEDPEVRKAYDKMIEQMGTGTLPMDVWLDKQGRARRVQMDMTTKVPVPAADPAAAETTTEEKVRMVMTEDIYDFGVPVNISPPSPEQTMSFEEFQRQLEQQVEQQNTPAAKS